MDRRSLGILAITLIVLMGIVAVAGLDNLPRELRSTVQTAATRLETDRGRFDQNRAAVERALAAEPDLFRTQAAGWRERMSKAGVRLGDANAQLTTLRALAETNRREDREKVEQGLSRFDSARAEALRETEQLRRDAERWLGYKRDLPRHLEAMRTGYETVHAWDAAAAAPAAQKAMLDWPDKRGDLQRRIDALAEVKKQAESAWENTAETRARAEAQDWAAVDYAALFAGAERVQMSVGQLQEGAKTLDALAGQLYVDRNKMLLDLDDDSGFRQRVRVVETKFPDATLQSGQTNQQERWETIDESRFRGLSDNVGMVVERKPAGKFDSEAERTAQAPAYAYVAPPGQANQYGSWSNGVWQWLPQYLILSQLLRGSYGNPITTGDYFDYDRARRRGEVWYGRGGEYRRPWGSSRGWSRSGSAARRVLDSIARNSGGGGWYRERPRSEPRASGSGGFSGSRYQSRGGYSGSRYQSRGGGFGGFGSRSYSRGFGRGFGRGGRR
jgi:hypothetical protein